MSEKKYIIVSSSHHYYCVSLTDNIKKAIDVAECIDSIEKEGIDKPRIFKIEKEIDWREKEKEDKLKSEKNSISEHDCFD